MAAATVKAPATVPDAQQRAIVLGAAKAYGIDPKILWGVYGTETGYGSDVHTSSAGAVGPFQFEPGTAKSLGINPLNFQQAAKGAAEYLSQYKGRGVAGMLSAYNAGPGGALQPGYVKSVLTDAKTFGGSAPQTTAKGPATSATSPAVPAGPSLTKNVAPSIQMISPPGNPQAQALEGGLLRSNGAGLSAAQLLNVARTPMSNPAVPTLVAGSSQPQPSPTPNAGVPSSGTATVNANPIATGSLVVAPGGPLVYGKAAPADLISGNSIFAGPDQGLDFTNTGHQAQVRALGNGVVTQVIQSGSGWAGQGGLVVYRLTSGPGAGRYVYTAEDFLPAGGLKAGSEIKQGQAIGVATGAGKAPGIETGFAQNAQGTPYGNPEEGKGSNAPDPQALAFERLVEGSGQHTVPAGVHVHVNAKGRVIPYRKAS